MHRYFAGKNVHFAAVGAHHQTALFVHIDGFACTLPAVRQVEGDPAAQIDAGGLVFLPEGCKAVPGKGVQVAVKAKIGQPLCQPCGVVARSTAAPCKASEVPWGRSAASK